MTINTISYRLLFDILLIVCYLRIDCYDTDSDSNSNSNDMLVDLDSTYKLLKNPEISPTCPLN